MTTQLLIYETAVPVSSGRHAKASVEAGKGYAFARKINSVPLMAVEFPQASPEYAVVFAKNGVSTCVIWVLLHFGQVLRLWPCSAIGSIC